MNVTGNSLLLSIPTIIIGSIILGIIGVVFGLLFRGIDRKLVAHMQGRIGPPIIQPFRDVRKLLVKETIIPDDALSWLFNAAPVVCLVTTIVLLLYIPLFGQKALLDGFGDSILILYLLIVPSLAFVAGGFASSSPYATVGAQREMVIMMSYEFSLALVIVAIARCIVPVTDAHPFMLSTVAAYPIWNLMGPVGVVGALVLLFALLAVTPGEVSKVPFDIAEAETEIAGGILVEYSGRNLALFYLADVTKAFVMISLVVALFFPYNLSPVIGISAGIPAAIMDVLFFLLKVFLTMFISVILIRTAMARFKISQASYVYLIAMTLVSLVGLILIGVDLRM
ncbi:MAG: NADH-quinone oxidoreductase subunit H [Dehalococcoidia bacterium]|nr:NADH-quinone oxidoreductase subunit H [Dehalococcoidia bacterium]